MKIKVEKIIFIIFLALQIVNGIHLLEINKNLQLSNDDAQSLVDSNLVCHSFIPFSFDVSTKLTSQQFKYMKSFLLNPFLSSLFPVDIQPAPYSTYSEQNHGYRRPNNVSDIVNFVISASQGNSNYSFIIRPLKYFVDQNVTNFTTTKLTVNTVIFAGNSITNSDIAIVQNYVSVLTEYSNTVTIVLMNSNIDQTNYQQVPGLNIVVWSDPATTINAIRNVMNCIPLSSTSITTTPGISESTNAITTTIPVQVCKSYIPFSFDISRDLTSTQFADLKAFLVNPFLESVFSQDVQPAWYSTYDSTNYNYTRPTNVADVINGVQSSIQSAVTTSDFIQPLEYLVVQGVASLGQTDGLAVNSVIFAGFSLDDVDTATFLALALISSGNTLTVVLMNPNIDTNYRQVPGLNIVVWSDPATTIAAIKSVMNCVPKKVIRLL